MDFMFDSQGVSENKVLVLEDATCIMKIECQVYPERRMLEASSFYATAWTQRLPHPNLKISQKAVIVMFLFEKQPGFFEDLFRERESTHMC